MTTTTKTAQDLAAEAYASMEMRTRNDGTKFWAFRDGSPGWMTDLVRTAHQDGNILPDDTRYGMLMDTLGTMEERPTDEWDEARDELESDVYYNEIREWIGSANFRSQYVNEAAAEFGATDNLLMMAQWLEKCEVWDTVAGFLMELAEIRAATEADA